MATLAVSTAGCSGRIALGGAVDNGPGYDAVVDASMRSDGMSVGANAKGYRTIGAALAGAPSLPARGYTILIRNGRYHEKLTVDKPNVHFVGESRDKTVLTYDAASDTPAPGGGTYGTRGSYTLRINATDFSLENMTVENAFDQPANTAKADSDPTKMKNTQAVAVMTDSASDRSSFRDCRITGHQDTLFPNGGRSYFHRCIITGSVDFIFGAGQTVIEESDIISRDRKTPSNNGYITAPSTPGWLPYGMLIIRSRLKKESPAMAANSVSLGRPWHPSADPKVNSAVVFVDTWMDDHIKTDGWDRMSSIDRASGERVWFEAKDNRMFEYRSKGPGAATSSSAARRILTDDEAKVYTIDSVLKGWKPSQR
jgi:pectinesterase